MRKRTKVLLVVLGLLLGVYVSSYLWLSRRGYAEADRYNFHGFYSFTPENTDAWQTRNYTCVKLFKPLNVLDVALGFGREPASTPLWGLCK
jgi:hypothetical protein